MPSTNFKNLGLDSVAVAKAIRYIAQEQEIGVNITQINKLLYISYGVVLAKNKERLTDEHPSAWPYGPVFPRVHKKIKLSDEINAQEYNNIPANIQTILREVVSTFGKLSAGQLSEWSHQEGAPWDIAFKSSKGVWNTKLDDDAIYGYFYTFLND